MTHQQSNYSKYRNQLLAQNKTTNVLGIILVCHFRIKQSVINTVKWCNYLSMTKLQRCKSKHKHNKNDITTFSNWRTSDLTRVTRPLARMTARTAAKPIVWCAPGRQCPKVHEWNPTVLVRAVAGSRQARSGAMGILNLVRRTYSSMHDHSKPSFSHTIFPMPFKELIKYASN